MRHVEAFKIRQGDFEDEQVKALLELHLKGMHVCSPPGHSFALDWSGLQKPEIAFYAAWQGARLAACGALKALGDGTGEIKSMRTHPDFLGQGAGQKMLLHITKQARRRCLTKLSLETGTGQPFEAALTLYRKHGFVEGGAFAGYIQSDFCTFMHKAL